MTERTMNDEIIIMIQSEINKLPQNTTCNIIKVYEDNHTDINSNRYGRLNYIETIGTPTINETAILIFLENDFQQPICIANNNTTINNLTQRINTIEGD